MGLSVAWTIPYNVLDARYATVAYVDAADGVSLAAAAAVAADLSTHEGLTNNPHTVVKSQVGLAAVTNNAQLKELDRKGTIVASGTDIPNSNAVIAYVAAEIAAIPSADDQLDPIVAALIFGDT